MRDEKALKYKEILITGCAGFIGSHLVKRLLNDYPSKAEIHIVGIDNMCNTIYSSSYKKDRLATLEHPNFTFKNYDIAADRDCINELFEDYKPEIVVNLAAQAGVRYSIKKPDEYIKTNIDGFYNILSACANTRSVEHLVYASSSSVYGNTDRGLRRIQESEEDKTDEPVSLYAATKKTDELLAHAFSKIYDLPTTGLRFFTVYGPMGRPDMAYFDFANKLLLDRTIKLFNYGFCSRDFTYIDDVIEGIIRVMEKPPEQATGADGLPVAPYRIYNVGSSKPVTLTDFIETLAEEMKNERLLPSDFDLEKHIEKVPMQPGDVVYTDANISALAKDFDYKPTVSLQEGLHEFVKWYKTYIFGELAKCIYNAANYA